MPSKYHINHLKACWTYHVPYPDDEDQVVEDVTASYEGSGHVVLVRVMLDVNGCLDTVPETHNGQFYHGRQHITILENTDI